MTLSGAECRLYWYDAQKVRYLTPEERATAAERRATSAEQRAQRLAEELRRLGIDPDALN
ncbi:MAG: hypothetical protein RMY62_015335 [Nostoc sp. ZfuVER08]|nr:hypothetical protein [Nostoc sp. ZfuVER08]